MDSKRPYCEALEGECISYLRSALRFKIRREYRIYEGERCSLLLFRARNSKLKAEESSPGGRGNERKPGCDELLTWDDGNFPINDHRGRYNQALILVWSNEGDFT